MPSDYRPDQLLPLSGIQHFVFCRRQWALIHVERQWQENALTAEGRILHQRVDDPFFTEKRKGILISRALSVASYSLGLTGICDVVEFTAAEGPEGVPLPGRQGLYQPAPVEYKQRGKEKHDPCDAAQLCAQAICLEEMLLTTIPCGYLYYAQTRHRVAVELTEELRTLVAKMAAEMHQYFERGYTPNVRASKACRACSLADLCLPTLQEKTLSAQKYLRQQIHGIE